MNDELKHLEKEKQTAVSHKKWKKSADHCNYIGSELCRLGHPEEALPYHNEELSYNDKIGDRLGSAVANRRIGECYCQMDNFEKALSHIELFKKIALELGNTVEEQRAWATLGRTFYLKYLLELESSDLNKAESSYRRALELAEGLKSELTDKVFAETKARCLLNLGLVHEYRGNIDNCRECIQRAIRLAHKFNLHEDLNRCQSSLASVYQKHEQYASALRLLDEAIASAEKLKDKTLLCDDLFTKATILIGMKDFDGAKQCLKRAYKLRSPLKEDHEKVTKALKICAGLCESQNKLQEIDISDSHERKAILEEIADGLSSLECYKLAIEFYLSTLQSMEGGEFTISQKAPILFSIAMTYSDIGDNDKALKYFNEELMCNKEEPLEQIKTLWKIVEILEKVQNITEAEKIHLRAISLSQQIDNKKLQFRALMKLFKFYTQNGMRRKAEKIDIKLKDRSFQNLSSDESDGEEESQDPFKYIHLSDELSDSADGDATDKTAVSSRPKRQPKKPRVKTNENGETPLHKACISGKLNEVKKLVECGHSHNVADYGNWMPLHEASNRGHYNIVEYLLDNGARINASGGSGITALIDAAYNMHLDVMQLLISRGASVIVEDYDGNTPLRALLKGMKGKDLDADTLGFCNRIVEELKAKMKQAGKPAKDIEVDEIPENFFNEDDDVPAWTTSPEKVTEKRSRPTSSSTSSEEEYSEHVLSFTSPRRNKSNPLSDRNTVNEAQSEYQTVMSNLRRSALSVLSEPRIVPNKVENKSRLVNEEENNSDDWLVWDTKQDRKAQHKRRKVSRLKARTTKSSYNYLEQRNNAEHLPFEEKKVCIEENSNNDPQPGSSSQQQNSEISDHLSTPNRTTTSKLPFWLRIRICDKCMCIPVPEDSLSIGWLAEEASRRYQVEYLSKPHLISITNVDGATLLNYDIIKSCLVHNEELTCTVVRWDEPSLEEHYIHLCKRHKIEPLLSIQEELVKFNTSCEINFSNSRIDAQHINFIFESLSHYKSMLHLSFHGTLISSSNIPPIISCFPSFVSLVTLNLSCCALFTETLRQIAEYLDHETNPENRFPRLKTLLLSHNLFCAPCSPYLNSIIQIPSLTTFNLSDCDLYPMTFEDLNLCQSLESCLNLQELDITGNILTDMSMNNFLHYLPKLNLVKLDLTYTAKQCPNFAKYLKDSITNAIPQLTELSLENCYLTDQDLFLFTRDQFIGLPKLKSIHLSGNSELSAKAVAHFLKFATSVERPMDVHLIGTCEWDIKSVNVLIDQINFKCLSSVTLDNVSKAGQEKLFECWKHCWNDRAQCLDSIFYKMCLL